MTKRTLPDALFFQVLEVKPGKNEQIRMRILEAAIECIAEVGFDRTTFDSIGKAVGMKRTHVNYYFSSRDELIRNTVRYAVALGQQITISHVQKANGWKERLQAVVEGPFEWFRRYPKHVSVMSVLIHLSSYDPKYRALQSEIRAGGEARLGACFDSLVQDKKMTKKRALELARAIQGIMTGNIIYLFGSDIPLTLPQMKAFTVKTAFELVSTNDA